MIDRQRLLDDCETVSRLHQGSMAGELADSFRYYIEHPDKLIPDGWRITPPLELKDKGVPDWRPWT